MKIRFWGVRGSLPSPLTPQQLQAKITAVVQRITAKDVVSPDAKEKFVSSLPSWIFGTAGGNSSCIELEGSDGTKVLLDAGSGIRMYGKNGKKSKNNQYHIFFSHFHWDHIQGLPFFDAFYEKSSVINFYSDRKDAELYLSKQQEFVFFPVPFEKVLSTKIFHTISEEQVFSCGKFSVCACKMNHPGSSLAYAFTENGKKFVYATDVELSQDDFTSTVSHEQVFRNADCIVIDSQYTEEEARKKANWGHSGFCYSVDFAVHWGIKKMYLFHHDPLSDDKKLNSMLLSARWYAKYVCHSDIEIELATEGLEFLL